IFSDIQFFTNGKIEYGSPIDSMIAQDTLWQSNGTMLQNQERPAAFRIDIDDDGDRDWVFSAQKTVVSENKNGVKGYRTMNNDAAPKYLAQNDSLFTGETLDMGSISYPMLYDYNKDGKPDLFVGSEGVYTSGAALRAQVAYYENITTSGGPIAFRLVSNDYFILYAQNIEGASLAAGVLENVH